MELIYIRCRFQLAAAGRAWGASPLLALAAFFTWALPHLAQQLQFHRTAIAGGELWRILTCHWTHCSFDHLFWDAGALLVLGILCEANSRWRFLVCLGASTLLIPAAVWIACPGIETYRGLSGIDSALFTLLAVQIIREGIRDRRSNVVALAGLVLAGFVAKILFETVTGSTIFVDSTAAGMVPIPLVHVVGGVVGLVAGLAHRSKP